MYCIVLYRILSYCIVYISGSGVQIGATALACIVLSVLGMLSPASRGSLIGAAVSLFFFFGRFLRWKVFENF